MPNIRNTYLTNAPLVLQRMVDRSLSLDALDPARRNTRVAILQSIERMKSDMLPQSTSTTLTPTWVTEQVGGTMNDSNTSFTITQTPVVGSLILVHNGRQLRQVASGPVAGQFTVSTTSITLGLAPSSGDDVIAQYQVA